MRTRRISQAQWAPRAQNKARIIGNNGDGLGFNHQGSEFLLFIVQLPFSAWRKNKMIDASPFRVGLSADFLNEQQQLIFPDFGLDLLHKAPGISCDFMKDFKAEYTPDQLALYDVVI